jgi:hypothetical protein
MSKYSKAQRVAAIDVILDMIPFPPFDRFLMTQVREAIEAETEEEWLRVNSHLWEPLQATFLKISLFNGLTGELHERMLEAIKCSSTSTTP